MPRLLLVRHAQSEWNALGRWQGWADTPLTPLGDQQAIEAAGHLQDAGLGTRLEAVVTSDLQRARRTGELISTRLGLGPVEVDRGFRERHVGEFSGLTRHEIEQRWPGILERWRQRTLTQPPGGETDDEFVGRTVEAVHRVAHGHRGDVLVVTHGGVIRALVGHFGGEGQIVANLGGRWLDVEDGRVTVGEPVVLPEPVDVTVPPSQ